MSQKEVIVRDTDLGAHSGETTEAATIPTDLLAFITG